MFHYIYHSFFIQSVDGLLGCLSFVLYEKDSAAKELLYTRSVHVFQSTGLTSFQCIVNRLGNLKAGQILSKSHIC